LAVIADPDGPAASQPDTAGPLDLQKERVGRIVNPEQLEIAARERAILDLGARRLRLQTEIRRPAVDRRLITAVAPTRTVQLDLEISGKESVGGSIVGHGQGDKISLEEAPGGRIVARGQRLGGFAQRLPVTDPPEIGAHRARVERRGGAAAGRVTKRAHDARTAGTAADMRSSAHPESCLKVDGSSLKRRGPLSCASTKISNPSRATAKARPARSVRGKLRTVARCDEDPVRVGGSSIPRKRPIIGLLDRMLRIAVHDAPIHRARHVDLL